MVRYWIMMVPTKALGVPLTEAQVDEAAVEGSGV
jgi:hypothetical protein